MSSCDHQLHHTLPLPPSVDTSQPMRKKGAIILATGGDNSNGARKFELLRGLHGNGRGIGGEPLVPSHTQVVPLMSFNNKVQQPVHANAGWGLSYVDDGRGDSGQHCGGWIFRFQHPGRCLTVHIGVPGTYQTRGGLVATFLAFP